MTPGTGVYLVVASIGDYSDRKEVAIAAYVDAIEATLHADLAVEEETRLYDAIYEAEVVAHPTNRYGYPNDGRYTSEGHSHPVPLNKYAPELSQKRDDGTDRYSDRPADFFSYKEPVPILQTAVASPEALAVFEDAQKEKA